MQLYVLCQPPQIEMFQCGQDNYISVSISARLLDRSDSSFH